MNLKNIILAALGMIACGSSPENNNPDGSPDSQVNYTDGNSDGRSDGSKDNNTNENNPPVIQFDPDISRNIRAGSPKSLAALVSDPDGDSVDCKFNFGDGTPETNYGACETNHTFNSTGQYTVSVAARDSKGLESSVSDLFTSYLNIPPHADAGPDITMSPGVYCFSPYPNACAGFSCEDGPFLPERSGDDINGYDEDGEIINYKIFPYCGVQGFDSNCDFYFEGCAAITYISIGTFSLKIEVIDNEGEKGSDIATVEVTN